jgi:uncharacterized glyoxalase superfamily protein PhnB
MTEACQAAVRYGFEQLGYDRIELWIDQTNIASQRVAQKLRFQVKGRIPLKYTHKSENHLMLVFGLWAHEWRGEAMEERPTPFFSAQPVLMVHDVLETAVFYRDQLGFQIDFLYGMPPNHAAVSRSDWTGSGVTIQLTQVPAAQKIIPAGYLYIFVGSAIDQIYEKYRAQGVNIVQVPTSYPWGMREFTVQDNNGHQLRFGTHR